MDNSMMHDQLKKIFNMLQDEESREVFLFRLRYFLENSDEHLWNMLLAVERFDQLKQSQSVKRQTIMTLLNRDKDVRGTAQVVLYGAGCNGVFAKELLEHFHISITCYCDSDPKKHGCLFCGVPVISPAELFDNYTNSHIIISTGIYENEIYSFLIENGSSPSQIFFPTFFENTYFLPHILPPTQNEVFFDVGTLDGRTICQFISYCKGGHEKIYAMEPDPESMLNTKNCLRMNNIENVTLIEKGAWSCSAILNFQNAANGASTLSESGKMTVPVTAIDSIARAKPVTFIKMDIEGAELEALQGAKKTIQKYAPKLAISIYHKPSDVLSIPNFIAKLVPEYRFYIRHHCIESTFSDTVLYAII
jgi:FkbM family methyltransferase